jgi:hypothetical protein
MQVFDETIVEKWETEILASLHTDMTERMFIYCIDELRYKSKVFRETGIIVAYDGNVVKSDLAIPSSLKHALRVAAASLEDVPPFLRDWHPGSNEMVLDLVHPSLFPVVYGRTRILSTGNVGLDDCVKRCGEGETLSVPSHLEVQQGGSVSSYGPELQDPYSRKFQWLPCQVRFDGEKAKYVSVLVWSTPSCNSS